MDTITTAYLTALAEEFIASAFHDLLWEQVLFTASVLIASIPVSLFIFIKCRDTAYIYKNTAPMKFHNLVIFLLPLSALRNFWALYRRPSDYSGTGTERTVEFVLSAALMLIAAIASVQLFRYKMSGLIGAVVYIWMFAAFQNYRESTLAYLQIPSELSKNQEPSPVQQVAAYAVSDYYATLAMDISLLAFVAIVILAVYYYHRRYIFLPGRLRGMPKCHYCGKAILRGDSFCGNCGTALTVNPLADPVKKVLDENNSCRKCGQPLHKGECVACALSEKKKWTLRGTGKDLVKGSRKIFFVMLAVYVVYYFVIDGPTILSLRNVLPANLPESSGQFSEQYNRLTQDLTLIGDSDWQEEFYAALDILYAYDSKWAYCKPRTMRSNDLLFYREFGSAAFEQMKALEEIRKHIELFSEECGENPAISQERTQEFWNTINPSMRRFIKTSDAMEDTQARYELRRYNYLPEEELEIALFDGFRFYMQFIDTRIVAAALLIAAFAASVYVLNFFSAKAVLRSESRYMEFQARSENRMKLSAPKYVEVLEDRGTVPRAGMLFASLLPSVFRILNELWRLLVTLFASMAVFISVFRYRNIRRTVQWVCQGVRGRASEPQPSYSEYKKQIRKSRRNWVLGVCLLLVVIHIWTITRPAKTDPVEEFMDLSGSVYWENGPKIDAYLVMMENAGSFDPDMVNELLVLIDDELSRIQAVREMQGDDLREKINKKYPEYWRGIFDLADSEEKYLEIFRSVISNEDFPPTTSITGYVNLGVEDFFWVYDIYHNYEQKKVNENLSDLAGEFE